jgi:hypothetical protein
MSAPASLPRLDGLPYSAADVTVAATDVVTDAAARVPGEQRRAARRDVGARGLPHPGRRGPPRPRTSSAAPTSADVERSADAIVRAMRRVPPRVPAH